MSVRIADEYADIAAKLAELEGRKVAQPTRAAVWGVWFDLPGYSSGWVTPGVGLWRPGEGEPPSGIWYSSVLKAAKWRANLNPKMYLVQNMTVREYLDGKD